jgi:hypothetical protein
MLKKMKGNSIRRKLPAPDMDTSGLKGSYSKQGGRCEILGDRGAIIKEKRGDGDPYNMSPERLYNTTHYTKDNVVLICQCLQIGQSYDFRPHVIRSWFDYMGDGFVCGPVTFDKPTLKKRRGPLESIKTYDAGVLVSKTCTDCGKDEPLSRYSKGKSCCKSCRHVKEIERANASPHGFVTRLANHAKGDAKARSNKRKRGDDSGECDDNIFDLFVSVLTDQGSRGTVTHIPFVYEVGHKFAPSPSRIDKNKGWVKGNIEFIIAPLNTRFKPTNDELRAMTKWYRDSML